MQITVAERYSINIGKRTHYGTLEVETDRLQAHVHQFVYSYGWRQLLNDAASDKTDKNGRPLPPEQVFALAQKKLDALYAGDLRTRAEGPADPFLLECHLIAYRDLAEKFKKDGSAAKAPKDCKDRVLWRVNVIRAAEGKPEFEDRSEMLEAYLAGPRGEGVKERAARALAEREAAGDDDLF